MSVLCALRLKQIGLILAMCIWFGTAARAEIVYTIVPLSPTNEIPPVTNLNATGNIQVLIDITRDSAGAITAAKMSFIGNVSFPASVTIQGLHIHEADNLSNGNIRFDSGLSSNNSLSFSNGAGIISRDVASVDLAALQRLIAKPTGFYVNLHTSANPSGALRGQITRFTESLTRTVALSSASVIPAIPNLTATGVATITVYPIRNEVGEIIRASINFAVAYDFPSAVSIRGLRIQQEKEGFNGPVRFDAGLLPSNNLISNSGKGFFSQTLQMTGSVDNVLRLIAEPSAFYINVLTVANPLGALRGQLTGPFALAPQIAQANTYTLTKGSAGSSLKILATNIDLSSVPLINNQPVQYGFDFNSGEVSLQIPGSLLANQGLLAIQIRNGSGQSSPFTYLVVGNSEPTQAVATESAGYKTAIAPECIASIFGSNLATQTSGFSSATLPTSIDETSVYVNGIPSPLFFVSPGQVNFQVPEGTLTSDATIIVRNRNGDTARATTNVSNMTPSVFTRLANGKGAPAAVASQDNGQTFPLLTSNSDGTPIELQVGNVIVLFGTGLRFRSGDATAKAGTVDLVPLYAGAQGALVGLDQINMIVPESLRGKGELNLTFTLDGKTTNLVLIKIR